MIRFDAISWHAGAFRLADVSFTVPAGSYAIGSAHVSLPI